MNASRKRPERRRHALLWTGCLAVLLSTVAVAAAYEVVTVKADTPRTVGDKAVDGALPAGHGYLDVRADRPCLSHEHRLEIQARLDASIADLTARGLLEAPDKTRWVGLSWPLQAGAGLSDPGYHGVSNFVDQNPAAPGHLLDYDCGARTYDLSSGYNHQGTDYFNWPFSWIKMDNDEVEIVAAAAGTIIYKSDGNYDRSCGFGGGNWNAVYVQHADGSIAWYGHMKSGSLTSKTVGQAVSVGEYLGVVGSSGSSTGPHLHMEIYDSGSNLIDPYAGSCNSLNLVTWWNSQRPYYDTAVNAIRTHSAPVSWQDCPDPAVTNEQNNFLPNDTVYFMIYLRDQLPNLTGQFEIYDPDGILWDSWSYGFPGIPHYSASWWYWYRTLPSDAKNGDWTYRFIYQGQTVDHTFTVGNPVANEDSSWGEVKSLYR